jgi:hypothetical protein
MLRAIDHAEAAGSDALLDAEAPRENRPDPRIA